MSALGFGARLAVQPLGSGPTFDFAGGVLPPGATLTRASAGTRVNAAGTLVSEGADVARFDHDPGTAALRGLLVEPARSNLLPAAGAIDQWPDRTGLTVGADVAVAPDGSAGADRLVPTGGQSLCYASQSLAKTGATSYVLSCFVKADGAPWAHLSGDAYIANRVAWFDLTTGTVGQIASGLTGAAMVPGPRGYWHCAVSFSGSSSSYNLVGPSATNGTTAAGAVTAAMRLLAWGMMLEEGASVTSLVPTTSAAATRAADIVVLNWASRGVPDGAATIRYGFDDGTSQDVATAVSGGSAAVPTNLARRRLRFATRL